MGVQRWSASVEWSVLTSQLLVWGQCVDRVKLDSLEMDSSALVLVVPGSYPALYYCAVCGSDLDECAANSSLCHQICENTVGSYTCTCEVGFRLRDGLCEGNCACVCVLESLLCHCDVQILMSAVE